MVGLLTSSEILRSDEIDFDEALEACRAFYDANIYGKANYGFDDQSVLLALQHSHAQGGLFMNDRGGILIGIITPVVFNHGILIASELAWWAPNGGGRELREAFTEWAISSGATQFHLTALVDENLNKVTENLIKNGYEPKEIAFVKDI